MLHLDFETRSAANIKKAGGWAYAADPSTRILICCIRLDDGPVLTWTVNDDEGQNGQVTELLSGYKGPMCAHNAYFERAVSFFRMQKDMGIPAPALEQWTCTAAMARKAALPSSLAEVAEVLKLDVQKDKRGFQLITLFSIPNKDGSYNNHNTHPDRWLEFIEYCKRDVDTEAAVFKHLHPWKLTEEELGYFHADMKMNERGIPLNIPMVEKCQRVVEEDLVDADFTFELLTGGIRHTQRAVFLAWLKERGYTADDLKADTLENYDVSGLPWEAAEAIRIRRGVTFASVKKLPTMLECQVNGKVHGGLLWWGAERTGRWAGRMIQPQNFKRPVKGSEDWYQLLKESDLSAGDIRTLGENPTELVAVMMRHFIDADEPILDADYAQIEARIVAWIAGQDDLLDLFSRKVDVYKAMASKIFGKPTDKIDSAERFLGKQATLGCGYGMGVDKFIGTCAGYGQTVSPQMGDLVVKRWRKANSRIVNLWYATEEAAVAAMAKPGTTVYVQGAKRPVCFKATKVYDLPVLVCKIPSGRVITYPWPKIEDGRLTYSGKQQGKKAFGRIDTWGGKLVENIVQAVAGHIMSEGLIQADRLGFEVFMLVHDQALAYARDKDPELFAKALTTMPSWADGLPLEADTKTQPFYTK